MSNDICDRISEDLCKVFRASGSILCIPICATVSPCKSNCLSIRSRGIHDEGQRGRECWRGEGGRAEGGDGGTGGPARARQRERELADEEIFSRNVPLWRDPLTQETSENESRGPGKDM